MATVVNITVPPPEPVTISLTVPAPAPALLDASIPPAQPAILALTVPAPTTVTVEVSTGLPGAAGANAQTVVLTLAAYLALDAPTQMNGTWYVIPK